MQQRININYCLYHAFVDVAGRKIGTMLPRASLLWLLLLLLW
jgi:hypothetical protein